MQLVGRANYREYGRLLGLPLDPQTATRTLALFLRDREPGIKFALLDGNLGWARRLVNGGSHGIAEFSAAYHLGNALLT